MTQNVEIEYTIYSQKQINGEGLAEAILLAVQKVLESRGDISILHIESKARLDLTITR